MTRPTAALYTVCGFALVCIACGLYLSSGISRAFESNPIFNSLILGILVVGSAAAVRQLLRIDYSARWMSVRMKSSSVSEPVPFLLVPLAPVLNISGARQSCGAVSLRAMIDGVFARVDDSRDLTRYFMNVLILLGLLGTFWGLLQTIGGIGAVIGGLSLGEGDIKGVFDHFKDGLQKPLVGMGISFSASLFGLASSLILGFMDLQAGRAQNRFCAELEEILGSQQIDDEQGASLSGLKLPGSFGGAGYQDAVVQSLADQLEKLQRTLRQQVELRTAEQANSRTLQEILAAVDDHVKAQHSLLSKMVAMQQESAPLVSRLADLVNSSTLGSFEQHARSIDLSVREFGKQLSVASEIQTEELRGELRVIARLLAGPTSGHTEIHAG